MTKRNGFPALCLLSILACLACHGRAATPPAPILFITADGFRTDYVEWYHPPNIQKLIAEGVRVIHATNMFPTVTTPNMASLVTGSYPRTTGVAGNSQYVQEEDRIVESPRANQAVTIAETLQKARWKTAAVNHFMLQNRGATFYEAPGYADSEKTTNAALEFLTHKDIRFVAVLYGATDHAGHEHGPHSEEVRNAVLSIDRGVGRLVDELKRQGIYEQTLISFNADHGMSAYEEKQASMEPAAALREAGFRVATSQKELRADTQVVVLAAGVRVIYFREPLARRGEREGRESARRHPGSGDSGPEEAGRLGLPR